MRSFPHSSQGVLITFPVMQTPWQFKHSAVSTDATNLCVLLLISEYFSVGSAMQKALYHFNEPSD